jgi:ketosteroid isomerase-like protein
MSRENVEAVRAAWDTFARGGIEATFDIWTDDCVFEDVPGMPDGTVHVGREGVVDALRNFTEAWCDLDFEPIDFIDAGDDVVVVVIALRGAGGGSGAPLDAVIAFVYEMRDRKVARARVFSSREEALEAAHRSAR